MHGSFEQEGESNKGASRRFEEAPFETGKRYYTPNTTSATSFSE
jgi:hypothetical protein